MPDSENHNDFGSGQLSRSFDTIRDEAATWLVAAGTAGIPQARLLYAEQGEGDAGTVVASSIASYLLQGIAAGFVYGWQRQPDEEAVRRITAGRNARPALVPTPAPVRVQVAGIGRGALLQTHPAEPGSPLAAPVYALVKFDSGLSYWVPAQLPQPLPAEPDLYEQYRADLWKLLRDCPTAGWPRTLRIMGQLWGPGQQGHRAAALLAALPLALALDLTSQTLAGYLQVRALLPARLELSPAEQQAAASGPAAWTRLQGQASWLAVLEELLRGLALRFRVVSAAERSTVRAASLDELTLIGGRLLLAPLVEAIRAAWVGQPAIEHGLPGMATLPADAGLPAPYPIAEKVAD